MCFEGSRSWNLAYWAWRLPDEAWRTGIQHYWQSVYDPHLEQYDFGLWSTACNDRKRINDKLNPLAVDEICDDLNLRFERLNMKSNKENEDENVQDVALFEGQFKGKCRNCSTVRYRK